MAADTAPNGPEAERGPSLQAMFADDAAPSAANGPSGRRRHRRRWLLAGLLLLLTGASTLYVGSWQYGMWIVVILVVHEAGHWLQAKRYGLKASPPYLIPFPVQPLGTLGAVIQLRRRMPHRRALFDIAVTGPLAGLVPALILSAVGVGRSHWAPAASNPWPRDESLLFQWLGQGLLGLPPDGHQLVLHPMAMAGWVGIYITALNLIPMGQLDGGHILYALLPKRAYGLSWLVWWGAALATVGLGYWHWLGPLLLLLIFGLRHPPTLDDVPSLNPIRATLGWLVLLFVVIGWSPRPFIILG